MCAYVCLTLTSARLLGWWAGWSVSCSRASLGSSSSRNPRRCSPSPSQNGSPGRDGAAGEVTHKTWVDMVVEVIKREGGGSWWSSYQIHSSPELPTGFRDMESDNPSQIIPLISLSLSQISLRVHVAVCVWRADMHAVASLCPCMQSNLVVMNSRDLLEGLLPDHDRS